MGIQKDSCAYKHDTKYKRPKQVPTAKLRNSRYTALSTASVVSLKGVSASTPTSEMAADARIDRMSAANMCCCLAHIVWLLGSMLPWISSRWQATSAIRHAAYSYHRAQAAVGTGGASARTMISSYGALRPVMNRSQFLP